MIKCHITGLYESPVFDKPKPGFIYERLCSKLAQVTMEFGVRTLLLTCMD